MNLALPTDFRDVFDVVTKRSPSGSVGILYKEVFNVKKNLTHFYYFIWLAKNAIIEP